MRNFTKLHLVLILLFVFSLSGLAVELIYLLRCRLRSRRLPCQAHSDAIADPELQRDSGAEDRLKSSKWTLIHTLCFKKQASSRVEPASAIPSPAAKPAVVVAALAERRTFEAVVDDEEDCDLVQWREMCLGPSRVLYTIEEEEEDDAAAGGDGEVRHSNDDGGGGGGTPFYTPLSSPPHPSEEARDLVTGEMPLARELR